MQRRYNLAYMILGGVVVLVLTLLMVVVDAQARIVFVSQRDENAEIYVMDADGDNLRNLTNHPKSDYSPSWSPDGKRIAFVSNRDGHVHAKHGWSTSEIYAMDADGSNPRNLTNSPFHDSRPSWSPDGKQIAFQSNRDWADPHNIEIYVMDANGGNPQNLTNNLTEDRYPSWSPDGKRIVFSAVRDGHFKGESGLTSEIYVMDADGGNQQRLTENRKNDQDPSWSPNSERIAFASDRKGDWENFEIYVIDIDGGNQQRLTENRVYDKWPSWSPDGKRIAFYSLRDGNAEIYVMDADGGNPQNLTDHTGSDASPAWLNSSFSISPASKKFTIWGQLKQVNR